jgi:hypothetical protein
MLTLTSLLDLLKKNKATAAAGFQNVPLATPKHHATEGRNDLQKHAAPRLDVLPGFCSEQNDCLGLLLLLLALLAKDAFLAVFGASCSFEAFNLATSRLFPWLWGKREEKELLTRSPLPTFCVLFPMFLKPL